MGSFNLVEVKSILALVGRAEHTVIGRSGSPRALSGISQAMMGSRYSMIDRDLARLQRYSPVTVIAYRNLFGTG